MPCSARFGLFRRLWCSRRGHKCERRDRLREGVADVDDDGEDEPQLYVWDLGSSASRSGDRVRPRAETRKFPDRDVPIVVVSAGVDAGLLNRAVLSSLPTLCTCASFCVYPLAKPIYGIIL